MAISTPETLIEGTSGNDLLFGNIEYNEIYGYEGDDTIYSGIAGALIVGGGGVDTMYGGGGTDYFGAEDGDGNDVIDGGGSINAVSYTYVSAGVTVDLDLGSATGAQIGVDTLVNINMVFGSAFADTLLGSDDYDELYGDAGNDAMNGRDGDDYMVGDAGEDVLEGADGNDSLFGGDDDDTLEGNDGDDVLNGGAGIDIVTGGAGADTFAFWSLSEIDSSGDDHVSDFDAGDGDLIDLTWLDADIATPEIDDGFAFIGSSSFSNVAGELRVITSGLDQIVSGDVDGDGNEDFSFIVSSGSTLVSADFLL